MGVEVGPGGTGVGVVDGEVGGGGLRPKGFEAVSGDCGHVDQGYVFRGGDLGFKVAKAHVALDVWFAVWSVFPDVADGEGKEDGGGTLGAGLGDVFAEVPSVGVDGFEVTVGEGDVLGLFADAFEGTAGLRGGEVGAAVVVAHLDEHIVAGLEGGEHCIPEAFGDVGA